MPTVFVDTVAWIALLNISGGLHTPAQQVMHDVRQQNVQLVTTEFVLIEVADALSAPSIQRLHGDFHQRLTTVSHPAHYPCQSRLACRRLDALQPAS